MSWFKHLPVQLKKLLSAHHLDTLAAYDVSVENALGRCDVDVTKACNGVLLR